VLGVFLNAPGFDLEAGVADEEALRIRDEAWLGERGAGVGDEASRGLAGEPGVASDRRWKLSARAMLGRGGSGSSSGDCDCE
jgi:hypothetical protein